MKKLFTLTAVLMAAVICCGSAAACDLHKGTEGSDTAETEQTGK